MQFSGELAGARRRAQVMAVVAVFVAGVSCKRDPAPAEGSKLASTAAASSSMARAAADQTPAPTAASSAAPAPPVRADAHSQAEALGSPPESFATGEKVEIANAVGLGCEARASQGWLQLLCRKKNGTGGRPVRAIRDLATFNAEQTSSAGETPPANARAATDDDVPSSSAASEGADAETAPLDASGELANVILPDEQGEIRVVVPWRPGHAAKLRVEWTDTSYDLEIDGTSARLVLPVSVALRRQCEVLRKQSQAVIDAADKAADAAGLNRTDVAKLPRFGVCQTAGLGAWALELQKLEASGAAASRVVRATLGVTHVDPAGKLQRAAFGTLAFAPQGLQAKPLMAYDYDGDGQQELIVRYEVTKAPVALGELPAVFTVRGGEVVAYDKLEPMGPGAVIVEQLDYDMRPDVADFGPYVAWLSSDCGAKLCPDRISGPQFFAYSEKDGSFSRTHAAALGALKRACPKAPDPVVVVQGSGVNAARTAQQLACAKVWKVEEATLSAALEAERGRLCSGAEECSLYRTLKSWVSAAPPATL